MQSRRHGFVMIRFWLCFISEHNVLSSDSVHSKACWDTMAALLKLLIVDGRGFAVLNKALICLIPKKPDTEDTTDYCPISLVHSFEKLFAKM